MSDLITDEMVEAALEGSYDPPKEPGRTFLNRDAYRSTWAHHMRAALEAAAPLIAAKALEEAAKDWEGLVQREIPPVRGSVWLQRRADRIATRDV